MHLLYGCGGTTICALTLDICRLILMQYGPGCVAHAWRDHIIILRLKSRWWSEQIIRIMLLQVMHWWDHLLLILYRWWRDHILEWRRLHKALLAALLRDQIALP